MMTIDRRGGGGGVCSAGRGRVEEGRRSGRGHRGREPAPPLPEAGSDVPLSPSRRRRALPVTVCYPQSSPRSILEVYLFVKK